MTVTNELDDNLVQALKEALRAFNRFAVNHSDNCVHRYCDEAPCVAGEDCQAGDDFEPCDPDECFAAACDGVYIMASALVKSIEVAGGEPTR